MGCAAMIGVSFLQIFWPSPTLCHICLYGGLVLIGAFTLYDVQKLIHKAKSSPTWDPINESLSLYLDAIMLFKRFLIILIKNSEKE